MCTSHLDWIVVTISEVKFLDCIWKMVLILKVLIYLWEDYGCVLHNLLQEVNSGCFGLYVGVSNVLNPHKFVCFFEYKQKL
jgi:hypothetical protein